MTCELRADGLVPVQIRALLVAVPHHLAAPIVQRQPPLAGSIDAIARRRLLQNGGGARQPGPVTPPAVLCRPCPSIPRLKHHPQPPPHTLHTPPHLPPRHPP